MKKRFACNNPVTAAVILAVCLVTSSVSAGNLLKTDNQFQNTFDTLQKRLVEDGMHQNTVDRLFANEKAAFDPDGVSLYFIHNEGTLNYDRFANKTAIWRAQKYIEKHKHYFVKAEEAFGVDKTVITAIILVETGLGTYLGKRSVFNTLSSMAALDDNTVRQALWHSIPGERRLETQKFEKKADRKSAWAYKELKAFIEFTEQAQVDAFEVMGSYAGAMGISQFMPSNVLAYAKDGNDDGVIDLFTHADAIMSIANYLKEFGWHPEIDRKKAKKVLYAYNHSSYYVNILIKISDLLKGQSS